MNDDQFKKTVLQKFDLIDKRFDGIDGRLDDIDGRLDDIEQDNKLLRENMNSGFSGLSWQITRAGMQQDQAKTK